jgi:hypothetical protein
MLDSTGSMSNMIAQFKSGLGSSIIPGLQADFPLSAFGVSEYRDIPLDPYGNTGDFVFKLRHRVMTANTTAGRNSIVAAASPIASGGGNDTPESAMEALYQASVGSGLSVSGYTFAPYSSASAYPNPVPTGEQTGSFCPSGFRPDSIKAIVHMSDAESHNFVSAPVNAYSLPGAHTGAETLSGLLNSGIRVIGISNNNTSYICYKQMFEMALNTNTYVTYPRAAAIGLTVSAGGMDLYPLVFTIPAPATGLADTIRSSVKAAWETAVEDLIRVSYGNFGTPSGVDPLAAFIASVPADVGYMYSYGTHVTTTVSFRNNTTAPATSAPQMFSVRADFYLPSSGASLEPQTIYIIVPPM